MKLLKLRDAACCGQADPEIGCICGVGDERTLRAIARGDQLPPLDAEERAKLIAEADWAGEGAFNAKDAPQSDQDLARWVLDAWHAYVQSNC